MLVCFIDFYRVSSKRWLANTQVTFDWPSRASKYTKIFQDMCHLSNLIGITRGLKHRPKELWYLKIKATLKKHRIPVINDFIHSFRGISNFSHIHNCSFLFFRQIIYFMQWAVTRWFNPKMFALLSLHRFPLNQPEKKKDTPKEYPNSNDMMGGFLKPEDLNKGSAVATSQKQWPFS